MIQPSAAAEDELHAHSAVLKAPLKGISHTLTQSSGACSCSSSAGTDSIKLPSRSSTPFSWSVQFGFKQQASQRDYLFLVCCLVREARAVSSSSSRTFHAICIRHTPRGHEEHDTAAGVCWCNEIYEPKQFCRPSLLRCIIHLATCACLGHEGLTPAEVGSSVDILKPQLLTEVAIACITSGRRNAFTAFWTLLRCCGGQCR